MLPLPTDLSEQALLSHAHECGTSILEIEGHSNIAKTPEWSDEGCFDLDRSIHTDLMVPGIGV